MEERLNKIEERYAAREKQAVERIQEWK